MTEAKKYGEVVDIPFPSLDAELLEDDIARIGDEMVTKIESFNPAAVMCQGEFTLTHYVVNRLEKSGVICLSACTQRVTEEIILENGTVQKESYFEFEGFRKYV